MKYLLNRIPRTIAIVVSVSTLAAPALTARQDVEQGVKSAYIYNFTKYVAWPASAFDGDSSPIVIGIVGQDSLGGGVDSVVKGKTAGGRRLVVRHLRWGQDLTACHVLFVPAGEMDNASALSRLKDKPILTIGESPAFAKSVGVINFVVASNRVRFQINVAAARRCGLTISSKVQSLGLPPD